MACASVDSNLNLTFVRRCAIVLAGALLVACAAPETVQTTRLNGSEALAITDCATTEECTRRAEAACPGGQYKLLGTKVKRSSAHRMWGTEASPATSENQRIEIVVRCSDVVCKSE